MAITAEALWVAVEARAAEVLQFSFWPVGDTSSLRGYLWALDWHTDAQSTSGVGSWDTGAVIVALVSTVQIDADFL